MKAVAWKKIRCDEEQFIYPLSSRCSLWLILLDSGLTMAVGRMGFSSRLLSISICPLVASRVSSFQAAHYLLGLTLAMAGVERLAFRQPKNSSARRQAGAVFRCDGHHPHPARAI
jgi:hypothetical protein